MDQLIHISYILVFSPYFSISHSRLSVKPEILTGGSNILKWVMDYIQNASVAQEPLLYLAGSTIFLYAGLRIASQMKASETP